MSDAAVRLAYVTKRFGPVAAVEDVSLTIEHGQFVTLLGPSGCGKTTLLRIVAGLEQPTGGDVYIDERRVTNTPAQARRLGFAFQRYALFPHLTVVQNVAFGLRVRGASRRERQRRALEMLELVHLAHLADRKPDEISGGQAQRVALARALAPSPAVLLLDEPLAALDLTVRLAMQEELRRIHRDLGTTFVYVTHDQGEALTMSDRILLMRDGRIIQDAKPHDLYREPTSLFAATFVGEANAWRGTTLDDAEPGALSRVTIQGLPQLRARAVSAVATGQEVAYVIRPERITLTATRENGAVSARAADVLRRGSHAIVVAEVDGGPRVRVEVDADDAAALPPGSPVGLSWDTAEAVIFPVVREEPGDADS